MKLFSFAFAALLLAGCSSVVMQEPFPDSSLTGEEMNALQGVWQLEGTVVYVNFSTNGSPVMASVEWRDGRHLLIQHDLHIAKRNDAYYLSLQNAPGEDPEGYLFAAFRPRSREMVVWGPDVAFFEHQIKEEKLKGSIRKEGKAMEIVLSSPSAQILDLIVTNAAALDYEEPLIFKKLD